MSEPVSAWRRLGARLLENGAGRLAELAERVKPTPKVEPDRLKRVELDLELCGPYRPLPENEGKREVGDNVRAMIERDRWWSEGFYEKPAEKVTFHEPSDYWAHGYQRCTCGVAVPCLFNGQRMTPVSEIIAKWERQ
jgi:hypothetical protein